MTPERRRAIWAIYGEGLKIISQQNFSSLISYNRNEILKSSNLYGVLHDMTHV